MIRRFRPAIRFLLHGTVPAEAEAAALLDGFRAGLDGGINMTVTTIRNRQTQVAS